MVNSGPRIGRPAVQLPSQRPVGAGLSAGAEAEAGADGRGPGCSGGAVPARRAAGAVGVCGPVTGVCGGAGASARSAARAVGGPSSRGMHSGNTNQARPRDRSSHMRLFPRLGVSVSTGAPGCVSVAAGTAKQGPPQGRRRQRQGGPVLRQRAGRRRRLGRCQVRDDDPSLRRRDVRIIKVAHTRDRKGPTEPGMLRGGDPLGLVAARAVAPGQGLAGRAARLRRRSFGIQTRRLGQARPLQGGHAVRLAAAGGIDVGLARRGSRPARGRRDPVVIRRQFGPGGIRMAEPECRDRGRGQKPGRSGYDSETACRRCDGALGGIMVDRPMVRSRASIGIATWP